MTVLTTVATLQYKAWRYPSQLVETRLVATYLPRTSGVRIAYERVLGTLDSTVGSLLGDDALHQRGEELCQRVAKAERVAVIEEQAAQRREAEAAARDEKEQAEVAEKLRIQQEREAEAARHRTEAELVERKAAERQRADEGEVVDASQAILAAERDRLDARAASIEARVTTKGKKRRA